MFKYLKISFYFVIGGDGEIPNIHWNNELKCRKFTRSMTKFIFANETVLTLSVIYSTICVCFGNYDTSNWVLQFAIKTPFDQNTVIGWYLIWFIQYFQSLIYIICMVSITTFFVCCCFYILALCDHFEELCRIIRTDAQQFQWHINSPNYRKFYQQLNRRFCQAIDLHVTIFE